MLTKKAMKRARRIDHAYRELETGARTMEHATICPECDETLFGDETCESVECPFSSGERTDG